MVGAARSQPNVSNNAAWLAVSPEIGPQFPEHGAGNRAPISGKTPPPEIGAQFGPLVGGIEPATFRLQACAPPTRPNSGGQHGHTSSFATWPSPPVPARPNPKSKLQTARLDFGFWILDFGFWISDFGFWILDFGFRISDFGFWILDFGFRILDFGFWISDFGFWILDQFSLRSFCGGPNGPVWILGFGFLISDFWFRILDFGFWISDFGFLDFGFWISDFGFRILDFGFWIFGFWILGLSTPFGSCIRYFLITPTRVGGFTGNVTSQVVQGFIHQQYVVWSRIIHISHHNLASLKIPNGQPSSLKEF